MEFFSHELSTCRVNIKFMCHNHRTISLPLSSSAAIEEAKKKVHKKGKFFLFHTINFFFPNQNYHKFSFNFIFLHCHWCCWCYLAPRQYSNYRKFFLCSFCINLFVVFYLFERVVWDWSITHYAKKFLGNTTPQSHTHTGSRQFLGRWILTHF